MRDDFSRSTIEALADRAGNRCSNPDCRQLTSGPRTDPARAVNIGVAAHITAASEGGPRYDAGLSREQRGHADNGLWLCQNCGKLVDNDPKAYPADLLRKWKQQAEEAARREVEGGAAPGDRDAGPAQSIHTGGGAYIGGGVQITGGDFVGRDKIVHGDEVRGDKVEGD